ncbi:MAG: hypothetical protein M3O46_19950 [Myxococcota bacterium]|nr:hypothetical protein [Myxococcota bacterium]
MLNGETSGTCGESYLIGEIPDESPPYPVPSPKPFLESPRNSVYYRGAKRTGWTFGRGGDLSVRVYDKTEELRFREASAESAKARIAASDKAAQEATIWAQNGWTPGEPVTRVEVQVRGTALNELCGRCEVKVRSSGDPDDYERAVDAAAAQMAALLEHAVDGIWQYTTRKWLRHVEPTRTRRSRSPVSEWWKEVQSVVFHHKDEPPCERVRRRSAVRSSQALGAAMSLATYHGLMSPWVDTSNPGGWKLPDEREEAKQAEQEGGARQRLEFEVLRILTACAPIILEDMVATAAGSEERALEHLIARWTAQTARYAAGSTDRPPDIPWRPSRGVATIPRVHVH